MLQLCYVYDRYMFLLETNIVTRMFQLPSSRRHKLSMCVHFKQLELSNYIDIGGLSTVYSINSVKFFGLFKK